jgi:hypothetical protein
MFETIRIYGKKLLLVQLKRGSLTELVLDSTTTPKSDVVQSSGFLLFDPRYLYIDKPDHYIVLNNFELFFASGYIQSKAFLYIPYLVLTNSCVYELAESVSRYVSKVHQVL